MRTASPARNASTGPCGPLWGCLKLDGRNPTRPPRHRSRRAQMQGAGHERKKADEQCAVDRERLQQPMLPKLAFSEVETHVSKGERYEGHDLGAESRKRMRGSDPEGNRNH